MFVECKACGKRFVEDNIYALIEEMNKHAIEHLNRGNLPAVIMEELNRTTKKSDSFLY
ncbi:MAG: hypothetical protein ACLFVI_03700 [Archaeoglobaceae archaeon]